MLRSTTLIVMLVGGLTLAHAGTPQEERNKASAIAYYATQNNGGNWNEARKYLADDYVERHYAAPQGAGISYVEQFYRSLGMMPTHQSVVLQAYGEGDLVALKVHDFREPGIKGVALMAFFRFNKEGKITDHWQVNQQVPGVLNYNGIF